MSLLSFKNNSIVFQKQFNSLLNLSFFIVFSWWSNDGNIVNVDELWQRILVALLSPELL